jgi:hypothetical protein
MTEGEQRLMADTRAEIERKASVFVLVKEVPEGKALAPDDFKIEEISYLVMPYNALSPDLKRRNEEQDITGCVAARYLGEGGVLSPGDIYPKDSKVHKAGSAESKSAKTSKTTGGK